MKNVPVVMLVLAFSAAFTGCAGLGGNIQNTYGYRDIQEIRVCDDDLGCRKQTVEVNREVTTSEPPAVNVAVRAKVGKNGFIGLSSHSGYNRSPFGYGYGTRIPVYANGSPVPVWLW